MEFNTKKEEILNTLQIVQNAISTKNTLPILSNLLIEALDNDIKVTATDLDLGISSTIPSKAKTMGSITIPAKKLIDIIKELPENQPISVQLKKNNTIIINCGKVNFKIVGLPKEEFPNLPEFKNKESIKIKQKDLKEALSLTVFASSKDETRYVLNGVLFVVEQDTITLVATDGRRLAKAKAQLSETTKLEKHVIVPTKTITEVLKMLKDDGEVDIVFSETQILFNLGKTKIISRLVEGEYPNYEQVIPKEISNKIKINRKNLLSAAKRASIFTSQESLAVRVDIEKNKMTLSKNTPYIGEVKEELDVEYSGKNIALGFNPLYLIELLKTLDIADIELEVDDADKPGAIRVGETYVYVVLPMQLV